MRAGHACNTCHIEPTGWKNPPSKLDRRCTLDCRGCHVDPTGGGMRKPAGRYFGREEVLFQRDPPSAHGDPGRYRDAGDDTKPGRFRLWDGFTGWDPPAGGAHDERTIADRFGDIPPEMPTWGLAGDFRFMAYLPVKAKPLYFPMQADVYGTWHPASRVTAYLSTGLQGVERHTSTAHYVESKDPKTTLALRELFVEYDTDHTGVFARVGRFNKPHGWMIPDHTSFVRRDEGFDESSQAFGAEAGFDANIPYANVEAFYQGVPGWPGEAQLQRGYGAGLNAGFRWLAAQVGVSGDVVKFVNGGTELVGGPIWALNAYPIVYLGEMDAKSEVPQYAVPTEHTVNSFYGYNELQVSVVRGAALLAKYDWEDPNIHFAKDDLDRYTVGAVLDPVPHVQLWLEYRQTLQGRHFGYDDALVQLHLWF